VRAEAVLLFAEDLARELRLGIVAARRALASGRYGRPLRVGRRRAVLAEDFIAALRALREEATR
jgi:hypothetical protein